jgi:pilus assembly protein CpaB
MAAKPRAVFIVGILAVAIAAFASYSLYKYLKGQERQMQQAVGAAVAAKKVVVADKEIPVGTAITPVHVKTVDWPAATVPHGAFEMPSAVVGRVPLYTYMPGDPIIEGKLVPKEGPAGIMTYRIPEGHRAMTVAVDQVSGVAGFITPGSMVDVVLVTTPQGYSQAISKIVLQNVPVLATGQVVEQSPEGKPVIVPTVTVDVIPVDAENLAIASTQGRLQLILRKAGDKELARTTGSNVSKVVTGAVPERKVVQKQVVERVVVKQAEAPAPKKPDVTTVEILKRGQKTTETFPEGK